MKFLTTILCAYILLVSAAPCCFDGELSGYGVPAEQQSTGADSHSDCSDMCSPFCICNTCGGFSVMLSTCVCLPEQEISAVCYSFFPATYSFLFPKGFWQPPRL
ncbi:MAG: hypothetical protein LBH84_07490 [Prevotellaceae bacterium]|jgi:hypothetical protein|nr:hypothetical protein [Prevotellaceae bacterium]